MLGRTLSIPLSVPFPGTFREVARPVGDLPATPDPRAVMPRGVGILALATIPVVLLTAGSRLGPGIVFTDILALSLAFAAFAAGAILVPWRRLDDHWLLTLVAIPVVYVASLNALTGAGDSPYSALYAPILAIAGWYLAGRQVVAAIGLVVATEIWRAVAIDGSGSIDVLTIALPFYATLAIIAALTGRWLRASLIATRRDQVRTAAALEAVRGLGADPETDVPRQLERAAAAIFRCDATVIRFGARRPSNLDLSTRLLDRRSATVLLPGAHRLHGMLRLESEVPLTAHDLRLASILAEAAGRTMDASETLEQTRADTERDALTGLLNRRALDRDLGRAVDDGGRAAADVALLFIDLDAFKELNDAHGHATGDAVLVRLGGVLRACARRGDGVYRYGGDEFAILLRGGGRAEGLRVAGRIFGRLRLPSRRDDEVPLPPLRASIGLAVPGPGASAVDLLAEADAAMYAAKRAGGGVVRVSAPDATAG